MGSLTYQRLLSNVTASRTDKEDIKIVTIMMVDLVINMERNHYQQLEKLQENFIDDLSTLNIGITGCNYQWSVFMCFFILYLELALKEQPSNLQSKVSFLAEGLFLCSKIF